MPSSKGTVSPAKTPIDFLPEHIVGRPPDSTKDDDDNWVPPPVASRKKKGSIAPSQTSSVHLQRPPQPFINQANKVLITQGSDDDDMLEDDDDEDDADLFSRLSEGSQERLPESDDERLPCSGSDIDPDIGIDIDNPDGYDTDLDIDGEEWLRDGEPEQFDPTGLKTYIKECNRLGTLPASFFQRHIQDRSFIMRNHGLGPLGAKAISKPLESNTHIERLDLEGNSIEADGAIHISRVLRENLYVNHLVLSENKLGTRGAQAVCEMLHDNHTISNLDLSGNDLKDTDGEHFYNLLTNNSTLNTLHLKHNKFEVDAARWLKEALTQNENLKILDLSWNHLRMRGAQYIADMVMENYGLKYLNLSMNGMGEEGARAIGHALSHNQCLQELNISANRITMEGALQISRGLLVNEVLETLRIGTNPIGTEGSYHVIAAVDKNSNSCIQNIIVSQDFEDLVDKMHDEDKRSLKVVHGGVLFRTKNLTLPEQDPEIAFLRDPMTKLKRYAESKHLRLIDLFNQLDRDNSWTVDYQEFYQGIRSTGIDMSDEDIAKLVNRLDADGNGDIDYRELLDEDHAHRVMKRELLENKEAESKKEAEHVGE